MVFSRERITKALIRLVCAFVVASNKVMFSRDKAHFALNVLMALKTTFLATFCHFNVLVIRCLVVSVIYLSVSCRPLHIAMILSNVIETFINGTPLYFRNILLH